MKSYCCLARVVSVSEKARDVTLTLCQLHNIAHIFTGSLQSHSSILWWLYRSEAVHRYGHTSSCKLYHIHALLQATWTGSCLHWSPECCLSVFFLFLKLHLRLNDLSNINGTKSWCCKIDSCQKIRLGYWRKCISLWQITWYIKNTVFTFQNQ